MRFTRLIGALLAVVLTLGLSLVVGPSASASVDVAGTQATERPTTSERAARTVTGKVKKRKGKLYLYGRVTPRKGPVIIQRATRCPSGVDSCNFKRYKKVGINKKNRYISRVVSRAGGDYFYRAIVGPASSPVYRVYRL